jgi:hypothetical protein
MLTPYRPGKYSLQIDAFVHKLTLDGCDDETGNANETGWYGLLTGSLTDFDAETTEFHKRENGLSAEDWEHLTQFVGAIVAENSQGFVSVEYFTTDAELTEAWARIEADQTNDDDDEAETDDDETDEPTEGDLFTQDYRTFHEVGNTSCFSLRLGTSAVVTVGADEDWKPAVRAYMDKQHFWPNVWQVSDHGNVELLSLAE